MVPENSVFIPSPWKGLDFLNLPNFARGRGCTIGKYLQWVLSVHKRVTKKELNQVSYDHRSDERNLSNCVKKPEKVRTSTGFEPVNPVKPVNREVTGSNPVEVLTFSGFFTQLLKLRSSLR